MKKAFTLVEMLLVVTIIAILAAVSFPAISAVLETVRIASCGNNLRGMANAAKSHNSALDVLPTAGWGAYWTGDPNRGTKQAQPGGWLFQLLPYMEQKQTWEMALGYDDAQKRKDRLAKMNAVFLEIAYCPSSRAVDVYPYQGDLTTAPATTSNVGFNFTAGAPVAKTDYAACSGNAIAATMPTFPSGPTEGEAVDCEPGRWVADCQAAIAACEGGSDWLDVSNGAIPWLAAVSVAEITENDGTSRTALFGEKFVSEDEGPRLACSDDNLSAYQGFSPSTVRQTLAYARNNIEYASMSGTTIDNSSLKDAVVVQLLSGTDAIVPAPPKDDSNSSASVEISCTNSFGGPHTVGFNMVTVAGGLHYIPYIVDLQAYQSLGSYNGTKNRNARTVIKVEDGDDNEKELPYVEEKPSMQEIIDSAG